MPKKEFAIHADGPLRLEVEWKGVWKNLTIRFDGERVGSIADIKQLRKDDNVFPLPDGSSVQVRLGRGLLGAELEVTHDGTPVPGSSTDPRALVQGAYTAIFVVAGLSVSVGLAGFFFQSDLLERIGGGWPAVVSGCIFGALGWSVWRSHSRVALGIAIGLYVADALVAFGAAAAAGSQPGVGGIFVRIALLTLMVRGFRAIAQFREQPTTSAPTSVFP